MTNDRFEIIFKTYFRSLCYFAQSIIHDEEQAEDICSDAFLQLKSTRGYIEIENDIRGFLYTFVRNRCFSLLQHLKMKRQSHKEILFISQEDENNIEKAIDLQMKAEVLRKIYALLNQMPEQMKSVFLSVFVHGKSNIQVGKELNISPMTVGVQKSRALDFLRKRLFPQQAKRKHLQLKNSQST